VLDDGRARELRRAGRGASRTGRVQGHDHGETRRRGMLVLHMGPVVPGWRPARARPRSSPRRSSDELRPGGIGCRDPAPMSTSGAGSVAVTPTASRVTSGMPSTVVILQLLAIGRRWVSVLRSGVTWRAGRSRLMVGWPSTQGELTDTGLGRLTEGHRPTGHAPVGAGPVRWTGPCVFSPRSYAASPTSSAN
jgi:hypothetical protein